MKKRFLSLLLALCLLVGLMPTAVFAAESEETLYAQMLELGLVDADGALIEENTFTVDDGTQLSSLDELIEWLNQCDESDLDKIITVDSTGKTATVEQIMYALIIEYQIADVAGQLNTLASGTYAATRSTELGAANSYIHDTKLSIEVSRSENILTLNVYLKDKNNESIHYRAPYDIPVEVGAFADFFTNNNADYAAEGSQVPGTNCFKQFTIKQGELSVEFKLDLEKLRTNYIAQQDGLLAGNTYVLFQARTVAGSSKIPESSAAYCLKIADSTDVDPVVEAVTGGTIIAMPDYYEKPNLPYCKTWGERYSADSGFLETYDNKDYLRHIINYFADKDSSFETYDEWEKSFGRADRLGMGNASQMLNLEHVTLWTNNATDHPVGTPKLYVKENSGLVTITEDAIVYKKENFDKSKDTFDADAVDYLQEVSKAYNKSWTEADASFSNMFVISNKYNLIRYDDVKLPFETMNTLAIMYPTDWYINKDWCGNNDDGNILPNNMIIHGAMTLVDDTPPTVQSIDTCAIKDGAYSDFYPGDFIPIVVTFNEPVYGD